MEYPSGATGRERFDVFLLGGYRFDVDRGGILVVFGMGRRSGVILLLAGCGRRRGEGGRRRDVHTRSNLFVRDAVRDEGVSVEREVTVWYGMPVWSVEEQQQGRARTMNAPGLESHGTCQLMSAAAEYLRLSHDPEIYFRRFRPACSCLTS